MIQTISSLNCIICGGEGITLYSELCDGITFVHGLWNLKQCPNPDCKLIWLDPTPVKEDILKLYCQYITHKKNPDKKTLLGYFHDRVVRILKYSNPDSKHLDYMYLDDLKPGRVLDVGCGDGRRMITMKSKGWLVDGQDIDSHAAAFFMGPDFKVYLGELDAIHLPENSYDAVVMNHVIEHLPDPFSMLLECRRILKDGGRLVIVTPNSKCLTHHFFKKNWRGLEPPRHLHIFSSGALKIIGCRAEFSQVRVWTTCANILGFAKWSFLIQKRRGRDYQQFHLTASLKAVLLSIIVTTVSFLKKDIGDECVFMATK